MLFAMPVEIVIASIYVGQTSLYTDQTDRLRVVAARAFLPATHVPNQSVSGLRTRGAIDEARGCTLPDTTLDGPFNACLTDSGPLTG